MPLKEDQQKPKEPSPHRLKKRKIDISGLDITESEHPTPATDAIDPGQCEHTKDSIAIRKQVSSASMIALLQRELLLEIISFLPTREVFTISSICAGFQSLVETHDTIIFERRLETDFSEGGLLIGSMQEYYNGENREICKAPFKRMYLAFCNRWIAPRGYFPTPKIATTVTIPHDARSPNNQRGVRGNEENALVFIGRVFDHPDSCCLLKWEIDDDEFWEEEDDADKLVPSTALNFPTLPPGLRRRFYARNNSPEDQKLVWENLSMTLHAIDLERFRVFTLMEGISHSCFSGSLNPAIFPNPNSGTLFVSHSQSPILYDYCPPNGSHPSNSESAYLHQWDLFALGCDFKLLLSSGDIDNDTIGITFYVRNEHTREEFFSRNDVRRFLHSAMKGK